MRRGKNQELPLKEDIKLLYDYLNKNCLDCLGKLKQSFSLTVWEALIQYTSIFVEIFNRHRPGDVEMILVEDFNKQVNLSETLNPDIYEQLSNESRELADKFIRITTRGKRYRTVPMLLHKFIVTCIQMINKYRSEAGIDTDNPYVLCCPTCNFLQKSCIRICPLLRKFADVCGAKYPE